MNADCDGDASHPVMAQEEPLVAAPPSDDTVVLDASPNRLCFLACALLHCGCWPYSTGVCLLDRLPFAHCHAISHKTHIVIDFPHK